MAAFREYLSWGNLAPAKIVKCTNAGSYDLSKIATGRGNLALSRSKIANGVATSHVVVTQSVLYYRLMDTLIGNESMTMGQTAGAGPVAVGGVGGSGTRLIAEILRQLDYYIGNDLNVASDNLWFTLLFRRVELLDGDPAHDDFIRGLAVFQSVMHHETPLSKVDEDWVRTLALVDRPQHPVAWLQKRVDSPPTSIGRFAQHSLANFDSEDVEYVRSLGFAVTSRMQGR